MFSSELQQIPRGKSGLKAKIKKIRELVEDAKRDPNFRAQVLSLIRHLPEKDIRGEIAAIANYVKRSVRYVRDPWSPGGLELFHEAQILLAGSLDGTAQGDCDDHVILASAMLETIGIPTRYVVGGRKPDHYQHIWLSARDPRSGEWIPIELTKKDKPVGFDPAPRFELVETHLGGLDMETIPQPGGNVSRMRQSLSTEPVFDGPLPSDFMREMAVENDPYAETMETMVMSVVRPRRVRRTHPVNAEVDDGMSGLMEIIPQASDPDDDEEWVWDDELHGWFKKISRKVTKQLRRSAPDIAAGAGLVVGGPMGMQMASRLVGGFTGKAGAFSKYGGMLTSLFGGAGGGAGGFMSMFSGGGGGGGMPFAGQLPFGGALQRVATRGVALAPHPWQSSLTPLLQGVFRSFKGLEPPMQPVMPAYPQLVQQQRQATPSERGPAWLRDVINWGRTGVSDVSNWIGFGRGARRGVPRAPGFQGPSAPRRMRSIDWRSQRPPNAAPPYDLRSRPWDLFGLGNYALGDDELGESFGSQFAAAVAAEARKGYPKGWASRVVALYGKFLSDYLQRMTGSSTVFLSRKIPSYIQGQYPRGAAWAVRDWGASLWKRSLWHAAATMHAYWLRKEPALSNDPGSWPSRARYAHDKLVWELNRQLDAYITANPRKRTQGPGKRKQGPPTSGIKPVMWAAAGLGILYFAKRWR